MDKGCDDVNKFRLLYDRRRVRVECISYNKMGQICNCNQKRILDYYPSCYFTLDIKYSVLVRNPLRWAVKHLQSNDKKKKVLARIIVDGRIII